MCGLQRLTCLRACLFSSQSGVAGEAVKKGNKGADKDAAVTFLAQERWGASYYTQYRVLLSRAIRVRRFQAFSVQDISQFLIIGAP